MINIELVYLPTNQRLIQKKIQLPEHSTVQEALTVANIYEQYPEARYLLVGIHSRVVSINTVLKEGDRIELYRPLLLDPKEKRRLKARDSL